MDRTFVFEILCALLAADGRQESLFGERTPAVGEAFARSLVGAGFPELWFELPLAGEPWLDLHALVSHADARAAADAAGTRRLAFANLSDAYDRALAWFASQDARDVRQLALSFDTSAGDVDTPAVQLLVSRPDPSVAAGFLEAAGQGGLAEAHRAFTGRMPAGWFACYEGCFPRRHAAEKSAWVRVECIVGDAAQSAYAAGEGALRDDLARLGMAGLPDDAYATVSRLARSPFPLELQFDVGEGGRPLPRLSASVRFQPDDWTDPARRAEVARLAGWVEGMGLSDARWRDLAGCAFAKRLDHGDAAVTLSCLPAFVKLRWRAGLPADAKAYLLARIETEGA